MSEKVRAKKSLGQHFLNDENIAQSIVDALPIDVENVLEIGPGMGVLTQHLITRHKKFVAIEIDNESIPYLQRNYPALHIVHADFLKTDMQSIFENSYAIIGNFPYNISNQILFHVYENYSKIPYLVGMFQHEVALRITAKPCSRAYGILSVLLQAYYTIEYLFTVHEHSFSPPPKVKSAVIRLTRNAVHTLACDEQLFKNIIKTGFNQRRKMLRNALHPLFDIATLPEQYHTKRAEELSVNDYIFIANTIRLNTE